MNDFIKLVLALVVIVLGVMVYNEVTEPSYNSSTTNTGYTAPVTKTDTFKEGFIEGCMEGTDGQSVLWSEYCECTFNYMNNRLTRDAFIDIALEYNRTGVEPVIVQQAVDYCL